VSRTGPLTIDNFVEIIGIQGVGRFQNSLLAASKWRSDFSKKTQSIPNGKYQQLLTLIRNGGDCSTHPNNVASDLAEYMTNLLTNQTSEWMK
jgi:hypothetical protein